MKSKDGRARAYKRAKVWRPTGGPELESCKGLLVEAWKQKSANWTLSFGKGRESSSCSVVFSPSYLFSYFLLFLKNKRWVDKKADWRSLECPRVSLRTNLLLLSTYLQMGGALIQEKKKLFLLLDASRLLCCWMPRIVYQGFVLIPPRRHDRQFIISFPEEKTYDHLR